MVMIKAECRDNAIGMLESRHSRFLGWVGNDRYYLVDGVAWMHSLSGVVAKAESHEETETTVEMVRFLNRAWT